MKIPNMTGTGVGRQQAPVWSPTLHPKPDKVPTRCSHSYCATPPPQVAGKTCLMKQNDTLNVYCHYFDQKNYNQAEESLLVETLLIDSWGKLW